MKIRELSDEEKSALTDGLALAARLVDGNAPLSEEQVQELCDVLLNDHPNFAEGVIVAGLAFGELVVEKMGCEWVRVSDEHGEETALSPPGYQIVCHPISMIQKRIAQGQDIDVSTLRDETMRTVEVQIKSGKYDRR